MAEARKQAAMNSRMGSYERTSAQEEGGSRLPPLHSCSGGVHANAAAEGAPATLHGMGAEVDGHAHHAHLCGTGQATPLS